MAELEITEGTAQKLMELSEKSQRPVDDILRSMIEHYEKTLSEQKIEHEEDAGEDVTWTDEEVAELIRPKTPLTGKEMVEQGFTGGWEDMGIEDSVEWLAQQRAKRRKKHQW